jgi:hypothetical protein
MSDGPSPPADISIGRVNISGVSGATARAVGPAIEKAIEAASVQGRIAAGDRRQLRIDLPPGASERDIAAALVRALEQR